MTFPRQRLNALSVSRTARHRQSRASWFMRYLRSCGARWEWICSVAKDYLVVVDYLTDFFEVAELPNTLASAVVNATKQQFARHGVPMIVHTVGGPQFMSKEFRCFAKAWEFQHTVSSPYNSRSNGKAESAVKIAKKNCLRGVLIPIWPCWSGATRPPLGCKQAPVNICWPGKPGELCRQVRLNWSGNLKMEKTIKRQGQIQAQQKGKGRSLAPLKKGEPVLVQDMQARKTQWMRGHYLE